MTAIDEYMDRAMLAEFDIAHIPETKEGKKMNDEATQEQITQIHINAKVMYDDPTVIENLLPVSRSVAGHMLRIMGDIRDGKGEPKDKRDLQMHRELKRIGTTAVAKAVAIEEDHKGQHPKKCKKCGKTKARILFPKSGAQCKQCRADYNRERYQRQQATKKATAEAVRASAVHGRVRQAEGIPALEEAGIPSGARGSLDLFINPTLANLRRIALLTDGDLNAAAKLCDEIGALFDIEEEI